MPEPTRAGHHGGHHGVPRWFARVALVLAVVRYMLPLAAIPLIPVLVDDRLPLLLMLRPTKELLLLGGGLARVTGEPSVPLLFLLYTPQMLLLVWPFFVVGRTYRPRLEAGAPRPPWLSRLVPERQLRLAQAVLARRGPAIAVLGRVAAIAPTVMAAAAGLSGVRPRRYLAADAVGGLVAFVTTVGAGFALGQAYETGGPWLTVAGAGVLVLLVVLLARWVRHEATAAVAAQRQPTSNR